MTDDHDLLPPPASPEVGHPVRSFVAVLLLVAAALLVLQWSGALWPRLHPGGSSSSATGPGGRVEERLEVRNDGPLAVRVLAVDWPSQGLVEPVVERIDHLEPGVVDLSARQPARDFEIPAGGSVTLVLSGGPSCAIVVSPPRLHVDPPVGPDRTVAISEAAPSPLLSGQPC
jgi:hypothetical protein